MNELEYIIVKYISEHKEANYQTLISKNLGSDFIRTSHSEINTIISCLISDKYVVTKNQYYVLTEFGKEQFEKEKLKRSEAANIKSLEIEKLVSEVDKLRKDFKDYPETKYKTNITFKIAIVTAIVVLIELILKFVTLLSR